MVKEWLTSDAAVDGDVCQRKMIAHEEDTRLHHRIQLGQNSGRGTLLSQLRQTVLHPVIHLYMYVHVCTHVVSCDFAANVM